MVNSQPRGIMTINAMNNAYMIIGSWRLLKSTMWLPHPILSAQSPHPWIRPSPGGYSELTHFSPLSVFPTVLRTCNKRKVIDMLTYSTPYTCLGWIAFHFSWVQGNQYTLHYTPYACHCVHTLPPERSNHTNSFIIIWFSLSTLMQWVFKKYRHALGLS